MRALSTRVRKKGMADSGWWIVERNRAALPEGPRRGEARTQMSGRTVVPRERAERDIDDAVDGYFEEGGADLASRFIDDIEAAFRHLAAHANSGSPRYATELDLPGLRWPLRYFPYLIFFVATDKAVDVWRVLHNRRDIPETLQLE